MAVSKFMLSLLGWIGFPLLGISWIQNMDNVRSVIIFIVSLVMVMIRFYFWVITAKQNKEIKQIKIQMDQIEMEERRLEVKEMHDYNEAKRKK